jgi:hypothetical protein
VETNKAEEEWDFCSLTLRMRSTNRIEPPCCGQFDTNGQAEQGLPSTATSTGLHS